MEVTGKLKLINENETFGTFTKKSFVVTTDEQYPQDISIELHQDKCNLLDKYKIGDNIKALLNLRGKEWINKDGKAIYFNTIVAWKIEKLYDNVSIPQPTQLNPVGDDLNDDEPDDLPF